MSNPLIALAVEKIWCNPTQDNQVIFRLARLTGYNGVINSFKVLMTSFNLPVKGARFHVFQIGQIHPAAVNFFQEARNWVKLSTACSASEVGVHLYTADGIRFNLDQAYYLKTEEKNLVIAIRELPSMGVSPTGKRHLEHGRAHVYLQLYRNAYYASSRSQVIPDDVHVASVANTTIEQLLALQNSYNLYAAKAGQTLAFKNGYLIPNVSLITCAVGDCVEFVYDSSVKRVVDYPIKSLIRFDSQLDAMGKYILHHGAINVSSIEYIDDIDMYLMDSLTGVGVLYHRNAKSALRMLTHRDYSTSVDQVMAFITEHSDILSFETAKLRLVIRHSGYERSLIKENSHIDELYQLNDAQIVQAMHGVDSTVDVWKAEVLEMSDYVSLMGARASQITSAQVAQLYGYNSLMSEFAYPFAVVNTQVLPLTVSVNAHYSAKGCTVLEYNASGVFLNAYWNGTATTYQCRNASTTKVEFVVGRGSTTLDDTYDQVSQVLDPDVDYRFYIRYKFGDAHLNKWSDVTGSDGKYHIADNVLTWGVSENYHTLVRSNKSFYFAQKTFPRTDGLMVANLTTQRLVGTEVLELEMEIPHGEYEVFLNGRNLIQGYDYQLSFPTLNIYNKEWINYGITNQIVTIVGKGLCSPTLGPTDTNEFGHVINGRLSVDGQYDVRNDKPTRVVVGGGVYFQNELIYNEDTDTFEQVHERNGKPYCVKDVISPLKYLTGIDTYEMKRRSAHNETQISNYLTTKQPTAYPSGVNPIASKYALYSPFLSKIIRDFTTGVLSSDDLASGYEDAMGMMNKLTNYQYLLPMDPIHADNRPNLNFTVIAPHSQQGVVSVSPLVYRFMQRVVSFYASGVVTLSGYVSISS